MRLPSVASILLVAACGGDDSGAGPTGAFDCLGDPLPTTAVHPLTVTGQVRANFLSPAALPEAKVEAFETGGEAPIDSTTSDAGGLYTLTVATGGAPLNGYVRVTKTGYLTTYGYPATPLVVNATQDMLVPTSGEIDILELATDVTQQAGNGLVGVVVVDCDDTPIAGATVSTNPAGTYRYNGANGAPSSSATSTAADGVAYVFNVAPGDVTVSANGGGHTLRAHLVQSYADAVTLTEVVP